MVFSFFSGENPWETILELCGLHIRDTQRPFGFDLEVGRSCQSFTAWRSKDIYVRSANEEKALEIAWNQLAVVGENGARSQICFQMIKSFQANNTGNWHFCVQTEKNPAQLCQNCVFCHRNDKRPASIEKKKLWIMQGRPCFGDIKNAIFRQVPHQNGLGVRKLLWSSTS